MYAIVATRLDLRYVVMVTDRYMWNVGKKHKKEVKHIVWYLRHEVDIWYGSHKRTRRLQQL